MTPALLLLAAIPGADPQPAAGLKLPAGFAASLYADNPIAPDIYTMTIDDAGRVLVAGRGYVRVLVDEDGDGRADRAIDLIDGLKDGPMGLLAEGDSLYVVADGGQKRYRGYNGRDKLKGPPETLLAAKTAGEHDSHAVRRGPDGWLYVLCGNMAAIPRDRIDKLRSPVKDPVAGCLLRLSPDFKTLEVVADGFRNPYGFDFNPDGEPFTFDSDNERCVGLPWYEGCRFYHIVPGGNYGWRSPQLSQTWRKPPYFADVVAPIADLGRGSPTGVACYRHSQFPERYRGGFFLADWTFGRVYFVPLAAKGSTYAGTPEVFLEAAGENGFAPTALAVHPATGELFVSIGGRGTRGGVFRIRYEKGDANPKPIPTAKRSLEWDANALKGWYADAVGDDVPKRRRALELLLRWREKIGYGEPLFDVVRENLSHEDPLVRAAAGRLAAAAATPTSDITDPQAQVTLALANPAEDPDWSLDIALRAIANEHLSDSVKLEAVRLIQLALGDLTAPEAVGTVWEGYTFRKVVTPARVTRLETGLRWSPGSRSAALRWEFARTAAALRSRQVYAQGLRGGATIEDTTATEDFHNLIVAARLGDLSLNRKSWIVSALVGLDEKVAREKLTRDRHWPIRLEEVVTALAKLHSDLGWEVLNNPAFGRPSHVVFVKPLKLHPVGAARAFLAATEKEPDYAWTPAVVKLLSGLAPFESRPVLLKLWDRGGLEDAILPVLAAAPEPSDLPKFLTGLKSLDLEVVRESVAALTKLPAPEDKSDLIAAIRALRRLSGDKADASAVAELQRFLQFRVGVDRAPLGGDWAQWFTLKYPKLADKLTASDGFDAAAWKKRDASIRWDQGDAAAGRKVFAKATCAACHDGGGAVGPSLAGVSKRFGRDDLLTAVLQPSKDVSPRYRPTRVTTSDGKAYVGMIVYEAVDGLILQTGPDTTVRVARHLAHARRPAGQAHRRGSRRPAGVPADTVAGVRPG